MNASRLLIAMAASTVLFLSIFAFVVHKPLTMGVMQVYLDRKAAYLDGIEGKKIVILAGSNGRFSHRCETVEQVTGIPCANMSIAAGISMDFQIRKVMPYLRQGDVVYMPLEYAEYQKARDDVMSGIDVPLMIAYDFGYATSLGISRLKNALYYFDLKFLFSGLAEMLMQSAGIQTRFSADTLTPQGDESGHTRAKGEAYRSYLDGLEWGGDDGLTLPNEDRFEADSFGVSVLSDFLDWARQNDVRVVGGLPTIFNDVEITPGLLSELCEFYVSRGHDFVMLDNKSQYERSAFYDTSYHLAESAQIAHTRALADDLAAISGGLPYASFCESGLP